MEINNTRERAVQHIPNEFQLISTETGQPIIRHSQNILENAKNLVEAKLAVILLSIHPRMKKPCHSKGN
jgi:hypothetical protein